MTAGRGHLLHDARQDERIDVDAIDARFVDHTVGDEDAAG